MYGLKTTIVSDYEVDSQDTYLQSHVGLLRRINAARAATTLLALLMGLVVVGVAANSIQVYNATHLSLSANMAWLSLWPSSDAFDSRPTIALVVGASLVVLCNVVALSSHHPKLARAHTPLTFVAPFVGLVAAIIAIAFFYAINRSTTADTLLSWSCRWRNVTLSGRPHFATLCRTSHAGVYLAILLIPVEAAALGLAGWQLKLRRFVLAYSQARKTPSPALS
ncbi:hypothetical protein CMQ_1624 [Grosmannia clavigera kw1407]|uniref:Uncharacterized protein n=1 Tax=Grosmannia clavigera (strain kw1407 / UAMH 11150) TaxID=655863 RepID=F0XF93_GROCL|nr:uncharacterized protein CMQ_1624 [Grosmannia clavigera kw1407]EFX04696.1 hypothetical protein CMQ_1624 [Grosmannia clavigera kw1407]